VHDRRRNRKEKKMTDYMTGIALAAALVLSILIVIAALIFL